jgi:ABC-type multidrug transport system fused ATPase/permease subunit
LLLLSPLTFIVGFIIAFMIGWKIAVWIFLAGILYYLSMEILSPYLGDLGQCIFLVFTPIYTVLNLLVYDEKA